VKINKPLVSITSAFFNEGPVLLDMVKSVFAQTFTDWELILLDDGSTDNSLQLAQSIDDPRVRVFTNGRNLGTAKSLNKLTTLARGEYITRMDADDMCSPERIQKQLELFGENPDLDVVGTGMVCLDANGFPLGRSLATPEHADICKEPYRRIMLYHPSAMAKKSWFEKNQYDESLRLGLAEDFNLFLRSYKHSKFGNVPEALLYYRLKQSWSFKRMRITRCNNARSIFEHFRRQDNLGKGLYYAGMQFVKLVAGAAYCMIWSRKKYLAKRYQPLTKSQLEFYQQESRRIKNTELPMRRG